MHLLKKTEGDMMAASDWDWRTAPSEQKHSERVTMIRPIQYESTSPIDPDLFEDYFHSQQGKALTLNISSGGMLLVMDHAPDLLQLLKVHVPIPIQKTHIPTLAEVAWTRPLPNGATRLTLRGTQICTLIPDYS